MDKNKFLIFSGSSNVHLAEQIAAHLGNELGKAERSVFADGEIRFQSHENVRGADVFIIQSLCRDINYHIMELLLMADAFKRASAKRITAVITYYAYSRQDRKDRPRVPISARLMADLLETAGFSRILTIDLHATQIQGFFNIPVDNLLALPVFITHFKKMKLSDLVVVSPDAGGVERARLFAQKLNADLAIADKRRTAPNVAEVMHIIGDVEGKNAIIVDDIVDTAGTLCKTINALKNKGAKRIFTACTHGIFSEQAFENIARSAAEAMVVTDTIPQVSPKSGSGPKIEVLSVAQLFADAIESIYKETSVSKLFL
jgi:ribose-phosphate pyrophosphokinase